ncbi:hypothetical protein PQ469_24245 [Mucilaginibacter sp. KACC 22773]|uniref:hypothetical protein n=1 Tax=Mucilaginibacter sp. KACC 22773 TaxID=3025671 RepID=UPI0023670763|nr:hypothetical protein [Mucilaginibacter sp. KACC 22773]WDF76998.1 hypothetical protein PQ469_24245 [Mucilaginibacter sp. KACC 22773]
MDNQPEAPLSSNEKTVAGILLILFILLPILTIIAHWPSEPPPTANAVYKYSLFDVSLLKATTTVKQVAGKPVSVVTEPTGGIHWSTLALILVAAAGFLGNMVHISLSLTAYIGSCSFKRSWILWYFIKPFSAAGLALFLYFGLNSGTSAAPLNLMSIMAAGTLAGLFTDIATQKLKEIFEAIFKPTNNLPDKLGTAGAKAMKIDLEHMQPPKINPAGANKVTIPGTDLDGTKLVIKINDVEVSKPTVTPTLISFDYLVTVDPKPAKYQLVVSDKAGVELGHKDL